MEPEKISDRFHDIEVIPGNGYSPHTGCLVFTCVDKALEAIVTVKASDGIKNKHMTVREEYEFIRDINEPLQHKGIINILDYYEEDDVEYLVMDGTYGLGGRRERWRKIFYFFDQEMTKHFLDSLLDTLFFLQSKNILHEDIECANMILNHIDNEPILIDFGRASNKKYSKQWLIDQLRLDKSTKQNAFFREITNTGGVYATEPQHFHFNVKPIIDEVLDKWQNIS